MDLLINTDVLKLSMYSHLLGHAFSPVNNFTDFCDVSNVSVDGAFREPGYSADMYKFYINR